MTLRIRPRSLGLFFQLPLQILAMCLETRSAPHCPQWAGETENKDPDLLLFLENAVWVVADRRRLPPSHQVLLLPGSQLLCSLHPHCLSHVFPGLSPRLPTHFLFLLVKTRSLSLVMVHTLVLLVLLTSAMHSTAWLTTCFSPHTGFEPSRLHFVVLLRNNPLWLMSSPSKTTSPSSRPRISTRLMYVRLLWMLRSSLGRRQLSRIPLQGRGSIWNTDEGQQGAFYCVSLAGHSSVGCLRERDPEEDV